MPVQPRQALEGWAGMALFAITEQSEATRGAERAPELDNKEKRKKPFSFDSGDPKNKRNGPLNRIVPFCV
ncbi:hypothetical protein QWY22_01665 [Planococcus liqunii]|uniref:hypothetical protein n=1 Tax=Planococcus liqunii TaxID=3058394 RepID=UPI0026175382|nr:hypothetical protein [Planococcus sp. N056]WKA51340.1 hypothetical protein QWY22_01665 [Planococcus sp. N056]